jgi:hypothetical protein
LEETRSMAMTELWCLDRWLGDDDGDGQLGVAGPPTAVTANVHLASCGSSVVVRVVHIVLPDQPRMG